MNPEPFMRAALAEARKFQGRTSPNPAVGAVLVARGKIIARGTHRGPGTPHAEVNCLARAKQPLSEDAVLYVTLEPCSTSGRTPPCTEQLIASGLKTLVFGATDPNPLHAGRATSILEASGMTVGSGVLSDECEALNEGFNKWIVTRVPFVIVKCGMSLDGRLTRPPGEGCWLTSAASRRDVQSLRSGVDAIAVGAETVRKDNPRLTIRGRPGRKQPWRVVLTRSGKLSRSASLFTDRHAARTLVFEKLSLPEVLRELGAREVTSVLIEGGGQVLGDALDQRLADKAVIYVAPILTGGAILSFDGRGAASTAEAFRLERVRYDRIGTDLRATGYFPKNF